ncbi:Bidirectional sugar transporter SWEET15 [Glycine max]|nr:Bidirectional sugar transporter SWEET15 [Glycine max]
MQAVRGDEENFLRETKVIEPNECVHTTDSIAKNSQLTQISSEIYLLLSLSQFILHQEVMETHHDVFVLVFGVLGNIVNSLIYLAPMVTIYDTFQEQTKQHYNAIPYSLSLFTASLMLYYAHLKGNEEALLLITINSIGCTMEVAYLIICYIYANFRAKVCMLKVVGWICATFSVGVYVTSLINPMMMPNVLHFWLGVAQMILCFIYRNGGADERERVQSETGEINNENDEILETIEMQIAEAKNTNVDHQTDNDDIKKKENGSSSRVELEPCEIVHLQNNIVVVTRNGTRIVCNEIQSVAEPEIVEIPG